MRKFWLLFASLAGAVALGSCGEDAITGPDGSGLDPSSSSPKAVHLPAGSVDGLAAAIAAAGPGGEVVLDAGPHTESGTVLISHTVTLRGQGSAVLTVDTAPGPVVDPALHVLNAERVEIRNLQIHPAGSVGGLGILLERADHAVVSGNKIYDHQVSVLVEKSNHVEIALNLIEASPAWQTGEVGECHGVVVMNGRFANVHGNNVSQALFGAWLCDGKGEAWENVLSGNFIGLILCKVPEGGFVLPSGEVTGSQFPATAWHVHNNVAKNNFDDGYLVIDGANRNHMANNGAFGNGSYDLELTGDTYRFGFLTPAARNNVVTVAEYKSLRVKDCGINNRLIAPDPIDTTVEPCY